jgi:hypothetical protein
MSTSNERLRWLAQVRKIAVEALTAHTLTDEESELVLMDLALNSKQQRLDQPARTDPFGLAMPGWTSGCESRCGPTMPKGDTGGGDVVEKCPSTGQRPAWRDMRARKNRPKTHILVSET